MSVRIYCPVCKGGDNVIWKGSIFEWGQELEKEYPPEWANYAYRHEATHDHQIMVHYPSGKVIPWNLSKMEGVEW